MRGRLQTVEPVSFDEPGILAPREVTKDDVARLKEVATALAVARRLAFTWSTLEDISANFGVSTRTARRYLYALMGAGIDIVVRQRPHKASLYKLDVRSWHGALYLPED